MAANRSPGGPPAAAPSTSPAPSTSTASPGPPSRSAPPRKRRRWRLMLAALVVVLAAGFALYVWATLSYSYSSGIRAGYVQKFSQKGWLCKTWEGELAMVNLPGTAPEIFRFTAHGDAVAARVNQSMGQRVALHYDQHVGVPSSCFGDTEYFVTDVQPVRP